MIYQAVLQFLDLLAACPNFRSLVGAADATAAKDFIHFYRTDDQGDIAQTQFSVIENQPSFNIQRRSPSVGPCAFNRQEGFRFSIVSEYPVFNPVNTADFIQKVDIILQDLMSLSGTDNLFKIESLTQVDPLNVPANSDPIRWQDGPRRGYHVHFSVTRSNR